MTQLARMQVLLCLILVQSTCAHADPDQPHTYLVDGALVDLSGGSAEVPIPGLTGASARTRYRVVFRAGGDLDGDGRPDRAALVALDPGGSGTFLHLAAILEGPGGPKPLPSVLLGDRVEGVGLRIGEPGEADAGAIVVGLKVRAAGQAFGEEPRVSVDRSFRVRQDRLVEISRPH